MCPKLFVFIVPATIYVPSKQFILQRGRRNVTIPCYGHGYPLPNITWTKDGLPVSSDQYTVNTITETNATSRLVLGRVFGVMYKEAGNYTCHVTNGVDGQGPVTSMVEVICKY